MEEEYYIVLMKSSDNYYALSSKEGGINVRKSEKEMIDEIKKKYNGNNTIAVLLNNIQFQPSIIKMSLTDMGEKLFDLKEGTRVSEVSSPNGRFYGLKCNRNHKNIEKIFESGTKVTL